MYETTPINNPAMGGGYTPYFYQSGLFQTSRSIPRLSARSPVARSESSYDFTSDWIPQAHPKSPQTVEQIIARGYFAIPDGDPTLAIISDKRHTSWLGLEDVISQIRSRIEIYQGNMEELEESKCEANNALFRQEAEQGCPANQRQRYSASKMIQGLYEQQRAERINLWRDVARVRESLPELAQQYLSSYRKLAILNDLGGERS